MKSEKNKLNKIILIVAIILFIAALSYLLLPNKQQVVKGEAVNTTLNDDDRPSDQVEINAYRTNPNKADIDDDNDSDSAKVLTGNNSNNFITSIVSSFNTISTPWYVARSAGIASYILMFLIIILGAGMTTGYIYKFINPVKAWIIHKYLGIALGFTLLAHIISLTFDKFINFSWLDVLIPFSSSFKPLFLSLGIFALYTVVVIIFSSLLFRIKYKKTWRGIHYAVYPLFIFSFIHGTFIGTDSQTIGMKIIYWGTGLIFLGLTLYRFIFRKK